MKKILIAAALFFATLPSFAFRSFDASPARAEITFARLYLHVANPQWTTVNGYDVATFYLNGYKMKAFFDAEGNLYSTVRILKNQKELTSKMLDNLHEKYPGFGMTELILESGKESVPCYYANITDGTVNKTVKIYPNAKIEELELNK